MATLKKNRGAQYPLVAEFTFNFDDVMVPVAGGSAVDFGLTVGTPAFDALALPANAVVTGGDIVVETAYVGPTVATVSVGDSALATRYAPATDLKTAARTALTLTGFVNTGALPVRLTFNSTVAAASAGKATVRVFYTIRNKTNEVSGAI